MRSLEHEGVTTLFGYPGGAIMPVYDALYGYKDKLNHVLVRHEQGATHAAQGYARVSGKFGFFTLEKDSYQKVRGRRIPLPALRMP